MLSEVYLGLGSNLGDRPGNIARAVQAIRQVAGHVRASGLYETRPQGFAGQPPFVNAACAAWSSSDPFELLDWLQSLQSDAGHDQAFVNGPRALDIDILIFGRTVLETPSLTIPHPRMAGREFVLAPLAEIAPNLRHPVLRETVSALLRRLPVSGEVRRVGPPP